MSMIANFKKISPSQLEEIKNNPSIIESIIYPETDAGSPDNEIDIGKSWEGIHFVLTGHKFDEGTAPLRNVIMGGKEIGEDVGYGPARYMMPEEVRQTWESIRNFSEEDFKKNFNSEKIQKASIYPFYDTKPNEEDLDYLLSNFKKLKEFYQSIVEKEYIMLLYVN